MNNDNEKLEDLLQEKLSGQIMDCLRETRRPMTSLEIAEALEQGRIRDVDDALARRHANVQMVVCRLFIRGRVECVGRGLGSKPVYQAVEIGTCEWCGLTDHHLVAGECPQCRKPVLYLHPHRIKPEAADEQQEVRDGAPA